MGMKIGSYQLVGFLGRGRTSVVFLAKSKQNKIALKITETTTAREEVARLERISHDSLLFYEEVDTTKQMLKAWGLGEKHALFQETRLGLIGLKHVPGECPVMTRPYEGKLNFGEWLIEINEGPARQYLKWDLSIRDRIHFLVQLLEALASIHDKGLVHGDISPRNLIYDLEQKKLTVIDFGGSGGGTSAWNSPWHFNHDRALPAEADIFCTFLWGSRLGIPGFEIYTRKYFGKYPISPGTMPSSLPTAREVRDFLLEIKPRMVRKFIIGSLVVIGLVGFWFFKC